MHLKLDTSGGRILCCLLLMSPNFQKVLADAFMVKTVPSNNKHLFLCFILNIQSLLYQKCSEICKGDNFENSVFIFTVDPFHLDSPREAFSAYLLFLPLCLLLPLSLRMFCLCRFHFNPMKSLCANHQIKVMEYYTTIKAEQFIE